MNDRDKMSPQPLERLAAPDRQVPAEGVANDADDDLEVSDQWYRSFFRDFDGIAFRGKLAYRPVRLTGAVQEITGYSAQEFLAGTVRVEQILHPDDRAAVQESATQLRTMPGCRVEREYRIVRKDGTIRWVREVVHNLCDACRKPIAVQGIIYDITDQKNTEASLYYSEQLYRSLAESTADVVYVVDRNGKLRYANRAAAELIGISVSDLVGKSQADLFPPQVARLHVERVQRIFETGEPSEMDALFHFGSNNVWLNIRSVPLRDEQERVTSVMGVCRNITERKRAEESLKRSHDELERRVEERTAALSAANERLQKEIDERNRVEAKLRANEERLRLALDGTSDGYWERDIETDSLFFSPRHCALLGYEPSEMPKNHRQWEQMVHPEDRGPALASVAKTLDGHASTFEVEFRARAKSGEWLWLQGRGKVVRRDADGRPLRTVGVNIDITERKKAEEALRASEERYRAVVEDQTELICRLTADGTFTFVNQAFCRFFGKAAEEVLGRRWQPVALEEDAPKVEAQLQAMSPDNPLITVENRVYSRQGEIRWMQFANHGFFDPDGRLREIQAVGRDITERKRFEEALERDKRTLKHLLQSSDHERQLIAYEIHDGLAQQLAGALMQFEAFSHRKDFGPQAAADAFQAGMTMLRQSHFEARRLISGVRPPILDEAGVVAAVAHLVNEERRKRGPKIEFANEVEFERVAPILENAIYRIVEEGLNNACRHSHSNWVRVELTQRGDRLQIVIRDRGVGFNPDEIGERHFGVAGIRERARLLGGLATIDSAPGKGTSLAVELPVMLGDGNEQG